MSTWHVHVGCVLDVLPTLAERSVRCCVTSPPYWGLRDYGVDGQIGLEPTPDEYIARMVAVFREVRRVLADDGTVWLNLGDSYAMSTKGSSGKGDKQTTNVGTLLEDRRWAVPSGLKPKDLVGIPWLLAFALRADGWYLRSDIIWHKPNPMPESVTDRPTKGHEYLFLLSKSERYFYDAEAIKEPLTSDRDDMKTKGMRTGLGYMQQDRVPSNSRKKMPPIGGIKHAENGHNAPQVGNVADWPDGRNKRTVWTIPTQPYKEAHFATFPEKLVEPCILAGSAIGDTVLDPFNGSGTTGAVAVRHGRNYVGIELNPEYAAMARRRIGKEAPLFIEKAP